MFWDSSFFKINLSMVLKNSARYKNDPQIFFKYTSNIKPNQQKRKKVTLEE